MKISSRRGSSGNPEPPVGAVLIGSGTTTGLPSQDELLWSDLAGYPVLAWSVRAFLELPQVRQIVLLVGPGKELAAKGLVENAGWPESKSSMTIVPDPSPDNMVLAGLEILHPDCELVVLHHCNRPLVTSALIANGIATLQDHPESGAVGYQPVRETIKRTEDGLVVSTPHRAQLALIQTPQVFWRTWLIDAYHTYQAAFSTTRPFPDAASLALALGLPLVPFAGEPENIVITHPDELVLAECILGRRRQQADELH